MKLILLVILLPWFIIICYWNECNKDISMFYYLFEDFENILFLNLTFPKCIWLLKSITVTKAFRRFSTWQIDGTHICFNHQYSLPKRIHRHIYFKLEKYGLSPNTCLRNISKCNQLLKSLKFFIQAKILHLTSRQSFPSNKNIQQLRLYSGLVNL